MAVIGPLATRQVIAPKALVGLPSASTPVTVNATGAAPLAPVSVAGTTASAAARPGVIVAAACAVGP